MMFLRQITIVLIAVCSLLGCNKDNNSGSTAMPPANLVIGTTVSTDGTGNVDFKATADNASSFKFEFGNGEIKDVPGGVITYRYTTIGTLTYTVKVTAYSPAGKSISSTKDITVTVSSNAQVLIWSDEFGNTGLPDASKWTYDIGTGSGGWGNNELQYYTSRIENAYCENGLLKVKAIKENFSGSQYTSARLVTRGKYEFKYGKIEIRAKLPVGVGTWPAFWMLGANINTVGWPACGEIDIMEHKGADLNRIHGSLHYPGRSGGSAVTTTKVISNATTEFHIYTVDWKSSSIEFYIDNQLYFTVANSANLPFNQNFYVLINLAMGGTFGGNVDPSFSNAVMEVDYIRVYR